MYKLAEPILTHAAFANKYRKDDGNLDAKFAHILHKDFVAVANSLLDVKGKEFVLDEQNQDFYYTLIQYFSRNENFFKSPVLINRKKASFNKGLLVCGLNGVGKSFLFRVFNELNPLITYTANSFSMVTSSQVVEEFNHQGHKGIGQYGKGQRYFDDIGAEESGNHYGKEEIFRIMLEKRYNIFVEHGHKTHISTNMSEEEIATRYGKRVGSRLYEMFNFIHAKGRDMRKL